MKKMIFLGIVVSVFAFAGMANASAAPVCNDGLLEPDILLEPINGGCSAVVVSGVPEKTLRPNRWVVIQDLCVNTEFVPLPTWYSFHPGMGNQGEFNPNSQTLGCNCADIIEIMEAYDPELVLDGHRMFGCSKSLIEEFIGAYGDVVW